MTKRIDEIYETAKNIFNETGQCTRKDIASAMPMNIKTVQSYVSELVVSGRISTLRGRICAFPEPNKDWLQKPIVNIARSN